MALFSYDENSPTSNRDTVRMMLQDVDGSVKTGERANWTFYLTDGEIDRAIALRGDNYSAAALGCLMMASSDLCRNKAVRLGQFSTTNEAAAHWREMAADFARIAGQKATATNAEIAWDEFSSAELEQVKADRGETN
jgi:hypothetical protein